MRLAAFILDVQELPELLEVRVFVIDLAPTLLFQHFLFERCEPHETGASPFFGKKLRNVNLILKSKHFSAYRLKVRLLSKQASDLFFGS